MKISWKYENFVRTYRLAFTKSHAHGLILITLTVNNNVYSLFCVCVLRFLFCYSQFSFYFFFAVFCVFVLFCFICSAQAPCFFLDSLTKDVWYDTDCRQPVSFRFHSTNQYSRTNAHGIWAEREREGEGGAIIDRDRNRQQEWMSDRRVYYNYCQYNVLLWFASNARSESVRATSSPVYVTT